jgi:hypothetical protein
MLGPVITKAFIAPKDNRRMSARILRDQGTPRCGWR